MNRRDVLRIGGTATAATLAGCAGLLETQSISQPAVLENRPDAVYYPTHTEGMSMVGMTSHGDRTVGVMFSYPHRFWTVTGTRTERVTIQEDDSVHLMASVWDTETKTVLPVESGIQFGISQDGETVTERAPWPMLSQPMGFHFGDNVALPGDGTYTVTVDIGAMNLERLRAFSDKFGDAGTVSVEFEYRRSARDEIMYRRLDDLAGDDGAVSPMEMGMMPLSTAPMADDLPGRVLGEAESGDAVFVVTVADVDGEPYLAVCPRTPHNRYVLPMMSLSATLQRDGTTIFDDALQAAIDPERNYHYGAAVDSVQSGDELSITVDAPPQVSRHEGYETAFVEMPEMALTLG